MQGAAQSECCGTVSSEGSDEGRKRCREAVMNFREKKKKKTRMKPSRDVTSTMRTDPTPVEVKLEVIQGLGFGNNSTALGI